MHHLMSLPGKGFRTAPMLSRLGPFPSIGGQFLRYNRRSHLFIEMRSSQELRGWIPAVHPDGALYFVRESDTVGSLVPSRKILTDADLYNHEVLCVVETYLDQIADYFKSYSIDFPNDADLVLDLRQDSNNGHECGYYFADHGSRCIFWLDDYDAIDILAAVQVELNLEHVGEITPYLFSMLLTTTRFPFKGSRSSLSTGKTLNKYVDEYFPGPQLFLISLYSLRFLCSVPDSMINVIVGGTAKCFLTHAP